MPRFVKGQSGNAAGRPRGRTTREHVRAILSEDGGQALASWVRGLLSDPKSGAVVVDLLRFIDGPAPKDDPAERAEAEAAKPRIVIPDVDDRYGDGLEIPGLREELEELAAPRP
jgi:hypothetical protein